MGTIHALPIVLLMFFAPRPGIAGIPTKAKLLVANGSGTEEITISKLDPAEMEFLPAESGSFKCAYKYSGRIDVTIGNQQYQKDDGFHSGTLTTYPPTPNCRFDESKVELLYIRVQHKTLKSQLLRIDLYLQKGVFKITRPGADLGGPHDPYYTHYYHGGGEF